MGYKARIPAVFPWLSVLPDDAPIKKRLQGKIMKNYDAVTSSFLLFP